MPSDIVYRSIIYAMEKEGFRTMEYRDGTLPKFLDIHQVTHAGRIAMKESARIILREDRSVIENIWRDDPRSQRAIERYIHVIQSKFEEEEIARDVKAVMSVDVDHHSFIRHADMRLTISKEMAEKFVASIRKTDSDEKA